ncbi:hypothetical protein BA895_19640 [Humibacillus sp. DSM 29435]|uniref:DUF5979 domain-containing protein n=1 Tax=Humibacillus sp. DSM 29435 TaxID=1869167 RepID=UPI0008724CA0|nr:DUF5979 domain-containing protein [Humibacillus sp. DSM 29435]OFE16268.1 hypothetical protein BA895_19640 [Humibacillus sp. DSM 29435]
MADHRPHRTRRASPAGRATRPKRGRILTAVVAALGLVLAPIIAAAPAAAESPGFFTIDKRIVGRADNAPVAPGERLVYSIVVTCSNTDATGGCTNAVLTDPLPGYLSVTGAISVTGAPGTANVSGQDVKVVFTERLSDPPGAVGLQGGSSVTILVPVVVSADIPATENGRPLRNVATVDGTNTDAKSDDFTVVPEVEILLAAATTKAYSPASGIASPGTPVQLSLTGRNTSNVPVDSLQIVDPADPAAAPNPFDSLAFTGAITAPLPAGAEQVQVDVWVGGAWVNGPPGATATLPPGIDPADVRGFRVTYASIGGAPIEAGTTVSLGLGLEQSDAVAVGPVDNTAATTVTAGGATSEPATANARYTVLTPDLKVTAAKSFDPATIAAEGTSTVTLKARNSSDRTLGSLTITEPSGGTNPFTNGLTFTGWASGIRWPSGATGASVTYTLAGGGEVTVPATGPNTLPDPPAGEVVGFTIRYTGPIVAGSAATAPFTVSSDAAQTADSVERPNTISADSTAPGGFTGTDTATATLTTLKKRLAVEVGKTISPKSLLSIPGETATVRLSGTLKPFPDSTTAANELIVQDPADFATDGWWKAFAPRTVAATPIPADSTLTVQWWNGNAWVDVSNMTDLAGPQVYSGDLPADVQAKAQGLRFVYRSDAGFAPGTSVKPNLSFALKPALAGQDITIEDCAASAATAPGVDPTGAALAPPNCPVIQLVPPEPGVGNLITKDWDAPKTIGERTGANAGLTIRWSTGGRSGLDQEIVSDVPNPSAGAVAGAVFDSFDLARIDAITPALDPLLTYDRVNRVELFNASTGAWTTASADPCPGRCDGTFPGVALSGAERASTIAFRLVFEESPTRASRIGNDPTAPPVGSGVARSFDNDRQIHPVFTIRDDRRSAATKPVLATSVYNVAGAPGDVSNTASADGLVAGKVIVSDTDSDIISIVDVPVTANITKNWAGGPLGVPPAGSPVGDYPSGRASIAAKNTTPRNVDRLTITDPVGATNPFDTFDLKGFVTITDPTTIGAIGVAITLSAADGSTRTLTRAEALAATTASLADIVGLTIVYTGRIVPGAVANLVLDTRLRPTLRSDGSPVKTGTVGNDADVLVEDLVNYPGTPIVSATDDDSASIALITQGIGVVATKAFSPGVQVEPNRSPVTMTLTSTPKGPSRTNQMVVTDADTSFFDQYDFLSFGPNFTLTAPINRVQVDAFTGGTWSVGGGEPVLTGGAWVTGTAATTPTLPPGVTPTQVQGIRYTFTRADGTVWENPATPQASMPMQVQRRVELNTGGPVPSDLAGNTPAPGETTAGLATNTIQSAVRGAALVGGQPITADTTAENTIRYQHAKNSVVVTKAPTGARPPSVGIPYVLTFRNDGDVAITDPFINDRIPSDGSGPLLVINPDLPPGQSPYTYGLEGDAPSPPSGPPMPTTQTGVTVAATPTLLTFSFPTGTVLEVGQTYTITTDLVFRPGLAGNTDVTNTTGIVGQRPWDGCKATLDDATGECRASATVYPTVAGAIRGVKSVKATDDALGVLNIRDDPTGCTPDAAGFYQGGCVPVTKPGGDDVWRLTFSNSGNLPIDQVRAIDRMPDVGDTGAFVTTPRDSKWRPNLKDVKLVGTTSGTVSDFRVYYTSDLPLCVAELSNKSCPAGSWKPWTTDVDPADVVALKFETDFDSLWQPGARLSIDITTTAPAESKTPGADTIAWNTVAQAARTRNGAGSGFAPRSEGNKVGAALATGPIKVTKKVQGPAAVNAPVSFDLVTTCTSVGQAVTLANDGKITLAADEEATLSDIPWGSKCTVKDDRATSGASQFEATTVTVARDGQTVPIVIATNTYEFASLVLSKKVTDSALDQNGKPVVYGPFGFEVACTFLGEPIYATGYSADQPMTASFLAGETARFDDLPAGSECTATETDTRGAKTTTSTGTIADQTVTGTDVITLALTADDAQGGATNAVAFNNTFRVGSLQITKKLAGAGADDPTVGTFTVEVSCTLDDVTVYQRTLTLSRDKLTEEIKNLPDAAKCNVTEPDAGGASSTAITPDMPVTIDGDSAEPLKVTITNTFLLGSVEVTKKIEGDGADQVNPKQEFTVRLSCEVTVNGEVKPIDLGKDAERTLSAAAGLTTTWGDLPDGAICKATETDDGRASASDVAPDSVTVDAKAKTPALLTVTNRFDVGSVTVTKVIDGPAAGQVGDDRVFTVALSCTIEVNGKPAPVTIDADGIRQLSRGSSLSTTWEGLPDKALCSVTETDNGGATGAVLTPSSVTVDAAGTTPVAFTLTNTFAGGSVAVVKEIDGDGAGAAADKTFTVALSCTYLLGDTTTPVVLPGGGQATVSKDNGYRAVFDGLPTGAKCDVTEPDAGGADRTTIDQPTVTVGDGTVVTVTVTNTFNGPTPTTPPNTTPPITGATTPPGAGKGGNGNAGNGNAGNGGPVSDTGGQLSGSGTRLLVGSGLAALLASLGGAWLARRRRGGSTP